MQTDCVTLDKPLTLFFCLDFLTWRMRVIVMTLQTGEGAHESLSTESDTPFHDRH